MPGDRHVVIGTKKGTLQIFDLASSSMTEEVDAHQKEVWSIHLAPDKRGFVTSSGDKTVKFWQFELVNRTTEDHDTGRLTDEKLKPRAKIEVFAFQVFTQKLRLFPW